MRSVLLALLVLSAGCATPADDAATDPQIEGSASAARPNEEPLVGTSVLTLKEQNVCAGAAAAPLYCFGHTPNWGEVEIDGHQSTIEMTWNSTAPGMEELAVFLVIKADERLTSEPDATGAPPLTVQLGSFEPGRYQVSFFPMGQARGPAEQTVEWRVVLDNV